MNLLILYFSSFIVKEDPTLKPLSERQLLETEITQLKILNSKLVATNWELQDQIQMWEHKQKIGKYILSFKFKELEMGVPSAVNLNKLENMVQKRTATYWMKRQNRHMVKISEKFECKINSLRFDCGNQLEDMSEIVSEWAQQLITLDKSKLRVG